MIYHCWPTMLKCLAIIVTLVDGLMGEKFLVFVICMYKNKQELLEKL